MFLEGYLSPGLNQWERMHWRTRAVEKKRAVDEILIALMVAGDPDISFDGNVWVTYTRIRRSGPNMDDDNLAASFKAIGDALQKHEIVKDDRDIKLTPRQRLAKGGAWGTELILEAI